VVVAAAVRLALGPSAGTEHVLFAFILAVVVASRIGGPGPGLLASALSVVTAWYFFIEPRFSLAITNESNVGNLAVLAAAGAGVSLLIGRPAPASHPAWKTKGDRSFCGAPVPAPLILAIFTDCCMTILQARPSTGVTLLPGHQRHRALLSTCRTPKRGSAVTLTGDESYRGPFDSAQRSSSRSGDLRQLAQRPAQQATLDK
jgi:hypothetical protein